VRQAKNSTTRAHGELSLVEATMGRNDPTGAWDIAGRRTCPRKIGLGYWLGTAPKKAFDPLLFARCAAEEYGTGRRRDCWCI